MSWKKKKEEKEKLPPNKVLAEIKGDTALLPQVLSPGLVTLLKGVSTIPHEPTKVLIDTTIPEDIAPLIEKLSDMIKMGLKTEAKDHELEREIFKLTDTLARKAGYVGGGGNLRALYFEVGIAKTLVETGIRPPYELWRIYVSINPPWFSINIPGVRVYVGGSLDTFLRATYHLLHENREYLIGRYVKAQETYLIQELQKQEAKKSPMDRLVEALKKAYLHVEDDREQCDYCERNFRRA